MIKKEKEINCNKTKELLDFYGFRADISGAFVFIETQKEKKIRYE